MPNDFNFTGPNGKPQKITMATQRVIDRWHQQGLTPPKPNPGESQYFYASRAGNALENRKRGYYGEDANPRIMDTREKPPPTQSVVKNAARGPNAMAKGMVSLRSGKSSPKTLGVLLGITGAAKAFSKRGK
jgi:hypothetical protein